MDTETERKDGKISRQRSARRLRHEAQIKVFQSQTGNLESIRARLGLRPSQICEILKVHPSAWTRWTRAGKAPPHIYQMLDWYLELLKWRGQNSPGHGPTAVGGAAELQVGVAEKSLVKQDPQIYVQAPSKDAGPLASSHHPDLTSGLGAPAQARFLTRLRSPGLTGVLVAMWFLQTVLWGIIITLLLRKN